MDDKGMTRPPRAPGSGDEPGRAGTLERLASFRFTYLAVCGFVLFYVFTVRALESLLARRFEAQVADAIQVDPSEGPPLAAIQGRLDGLLTHSRWIHPGGVRVYPLVVGANGRTLLYPRAEGDSKHPTPPLPDLLLPAQARVIVSVPHNSLAANGVLVAYAGVMLALLFAYTELLDRQEQERLAQVTTARDALSERAAKIEQELATVREQLSRGDPARSGDADQIEALRAERRTLLARLEEVERREGAFRAEGAQSVALQAEYEALEGLLDEALADLERKNEELWALQKSVKSRTRSASRDDEQLGRRLRTLYKNLEIDAHALKGLLALRDESLQLRAEESLKRLSDESDQAAIRRKVGGLPPHLSIFELGFAGRGRVYFTKGRVRRFRVVAIGDKATQKTDLEYLGRLPREV